MADNCIFCEVRRPEGGTKTVVTNGGAAWLEFCKKCGDTEVLTNNVTGEQITPAELYKRCGPGEGIKVKKEAVQ